MGCVPSKLGPLLSFAYVFAKCRDFSLWFLGKWLRVTYFIYFMDASHVNTVLGRDIVIQLSIPLGQIASFYWHDQTVL